MNLSLNQILLTFLHYVRHTSMTQLTQGLFSINSKGFHYSYACIGLISKNTCGFVFMFLTGFCSFSVLYTLLSSIDHLLVIVRIKDTRCIKNITLCFTLLLGFQLLVLLPWLIEIPFLFVPTE